LEDAANALLYPALASITRHADKSDILTPWKEHDRRKREIYVTSGTPDPALRRGIFTRAANSEHPHLNSVEGMTPPKSSGHGPSSWDRE